MYSSISSWASTASCRDYLAGSHPPDYWAGMARSATSEHANLALNFTAMHHRSKAFWVNVNGKWVHRKGVMR